MTEDNRSRHLVWLVCNGRISPQLWFEPFVGCAELKPLARHKLEPQEHGYSLDSLARRYPAPALGGTD